MTQLSPPPLDDMAVQIDAVSKCFPLFTSPRDRLKQFIMPGIQRLSGRQVSRYYRDFWALRDITLDIRRGDSIGLIGRNGSGKSTLLQLIAGTLTPSSGQIVVSGRVSALLELGSGFNPEFTGRENVFFNAAILGLEREEIESRLDDILAFADIGEFVDQPLKTCSSGMIMRLAFAVAVCLEPEILIVDEALAVGDAAFQYKCLARIRQMIDTGMTFLFVSHDLAMVRTFCQRAVYLCQGRIVCDGTAFDAGEAYLQELRSAQRAADQGSNASAIVAKKPLPGSTGSAFGNQLGHIRAANFEGDDSRHAIFEFGTSIVVQIDVEYEPAVAFPCVALAITDSRHVNIGGRYSQTLPRCLPESPFKELALRFSFDARLAAGQYYMTVVMEDRESAHQSLLVDKQGGVLTFDILPVQDSTMIGTCDLGVSIETLLNEVRAPQTASPKGEHA